MNIPNVITLARLLSVPAVVVLIVSGYMTAAFWLFLAAGLSDGIDGFIAKRFDAATQLGRYLDPVADKALLVSTYVALGAADALPAWLVILVVSRDILIVGGIVFSFAISLPLTPRPAAISKVNTFAQIVLAVGVLAFLGLGLEYGRAIEILGYVVGALTAASGIYYVYWWSGAAFAAERRN